MGSYGGHVLPGSFFIIFGTWYAMKYSAEYFKSRSKKSFNYYGKFKCCGRLPCSVLVIEGCVKIFFTSVGTLIELFYPGAPMGAIHNEDGNFTHPMNWQHATMYLFFGLSGLADIISYTAQNVIPRGSDRIMGALALFVEGYLFYFHLHGRSEIDTRCHILLVLAVWPCALFAFLETFFMNNRVLCHVLEMLHTILLIFQGVWFWMVAYVLYPPDKTVVWDPCMSKVKMSPDQAADHHAHESEMEDSCADAGLVHLNLMFLTMFWTWALAFVIGFVSLLYFLVYKWLKLRRQLNPSFTRNYKELSSLKSERRSNGLLGDREEEDEDEF